MVLRRQGIQHFLTAKKPENPKLNETRFDLPTFAQTLNNTWFSCLF
jgi:hypothetical protein